MEEQIVDFDFLEELSGGDPKYKYELLGIFLDTVDEGMANLEQLIGEGNDYDAIFKQAHALKSSAGIIKVKQMHEKLAKIEAWARDIAERKATTGKEEINIVFNNVMGTYKKAHPLLVAERNKNAPKE